MSWLDSLRERIHGRTSMGGMTGWQAAVSECYGLSLNQAGGTKCPVPTGPGLWPGTEVPVLPLRGETAASAQSLTALSVAWAQAWYHCSNGTNRWSDESQL